ncbi:LLM class flavin-dependent oxidoreductase [Nocardia africana]|uniref:Monooxygenase moxC n=1 Tax=Nocardia africana TaxID=134964 RepID=A0A378WV89_9NOCA|nr:LLM class flavin-dependent oxidoreductase [Nocardia africana]MCC3313854.1 LLM class flavin-dependent oxidoreductase [Nocardia africana]SUA44762.1 Putative monooxygenase moxC [Nocardia africana]
MTRHTIVGAALDGAQVAAVFDRAGAGPKKFGALLDDSGIDFVVLRPDSATVRFDPSVAAAVLARHTRSVGLVVAAAPLRDHPYNLARRLGSIDHASGGRVGWLVLLGDPAAADGRSVWTSAPRGDVPADAVRAVRELWESWPADAVVDDRERGVFAESARIRYVDHAGAHSITGPLNIPEPPQVKPPVFAESPVPGEYRDLAGLADVVFAPAGTAVRGPVLRWAAAEAPVSPAAEAAGVVIAGEGTPAAIVAAAARHVTASAVPPAGTTLRARLGLPAPDPVLPSNARSAFPAA